MKRSFLKGLSLTPEQIDAIMEEHGNDIESTKEKAQSRFDTEAEKLNDKILKLEEQIKTQPKPADSKNDEVSKLRGELEKLKSGKTGKEGIDPPKDPKDDDENSALAKLQSEFDTYKANIEAEKVNQAKTSLIMNTLKEKGANPKFVPLLMKEFDLSKLELEGEGDKQTIKGFDDVLKPVQESYSDIFGKVEDKGANVANPPKGDTGEPEPKNLLESLEQKYNKKT